MRLPERKKQQWQHGLRATGSARGDQRYYVSEVLDLGFSWNGKLANPLFRNRGDGTFDDVGTVLGVGSRQDGRSFVVFDFDHDGDLDICVRNRPGQKPLEFFENVFSNEHGWLRIRLIGSGRNRDAVGARVQILAERRRQTQELQLGSGLLSQQSQVLHFGLGGASHVEQVEVLWPSGKVETFGPFPAKSFLTLREGTGRLGTQVDSWEDLLRDGDRLARQGNGKDAEARYQRGLSVASQAFGIAHPATVRILTTLVKLYSTQRRDEEANALYERAWKAAESLSEPASPRERATYEAFIELFRARAEVSWETSPVPDVNRDLERALALAERTHGNESPELIPTLSAMVKLLHRGGMARQGKAVLDRAFAILEKHPSVKTPYLPDLFYEEGGIDFSLGKFAEGEAAYERAASELEKASPVNAVALSLTLYHLAKTRWEQGKVAQSEEPARRAVELSDSAGDIPSAWPAQVDARSHLGTVYRKQGRFEDAERVLREAIQIVDRRGQYLHGGRKNRCFWELGEVYRAQGRYAEAEPSFERARRGMEEVGSPDKMRNPAFMRSYADVLRNLGKEEMAVHWEGQAARLEEELR